MESDRRLNRWGLTFTPAVINRLRKVAIYGQPQLSLEHQGRAKRYVVRGVESGGATEEVGYYVTFAGENGEALPWLQTIDSLAVNGPHAVVIAPVVTRIEMLRIARTYELCITRHRPVEVEPGHRPKLHAEELFRGAHGYLALELWGKDKDLSGCVRPQFFTRSGEEIELPVGFGEAVKSVTSGVTCLNCSHPHYSRLVATPTGNGNGRIRRSAKRRSRRRMEAASRGRQRDTCRYRASGAMSDRPALTEWEVIYEDRNEVRLIWRTLCSGPPLVSRRGLVGGSTGSRGTFVCGLPSRCMMLGTFSKNDMDGLGRGNTRGAWRQNHDLTLR